MNLMQRVLFPSPFEEATILTMDGVGEWDTAAIGVGEGNQMKLLKALQFPHSLGFFTVLSLIFAVLK